LNKNDVFNAVVPAYVDDEQNNEIEGSTTEYIVAQLSRQKSEIFIMN